MEAIRTNLLRRAREEREANGQTMPDLERQGQPEMEEQQQQPGRQGLFSRARPTILPLFTGRTRRTREDDPVAVAAEGEDGPKTPQQAPGLTRLPAAARVRIPGLRRTRTRGYTGPPPPPPSRGQWDPADESSPRPSLARSRTERFPVVAQPEPEQQPDEATGREEGGERTRFDGAGPAGLRLVEQEERRRHRRRRHHHGHGHRRRRSDPDYVPPAHFLFCFPWIPSKRIRSQILSCFVSGLFLVLMLSIYLALSITRNINSSEFSILLILLILFTTIFFCHGLVRLCLLIVKRQRGGDVDGNPTADDEEQRAYQAQLQQQLHEPGGYAVPRRPIRVLLARDEEAAGLESETTKLQPPAYGAWRESVRVDPARIYWQRNEEATTTDEEADDRSREGGSESRYSQQSSSDGSGETRPTAAPRPPSYASDDGVEYVVEARPRSMAPGFAEPLPTHPSEVGRI
ncbi:hypothetical protein F4780DRAFT_506545 [Xylariomycetidae sp. FL0641]|nr:hypothetical protein F4780DRAFT_506545 [Xylariomycetidae sp. FL0641]